MNVEHENLNNIHCLWIIEEYQEKFDESPGNIATSKIKKKTEQILFFTQNNIILLQKGCNSMLGTST